ncbi:ABC transporter ATP-binding protein [Spirochaetia bacterium]|nr:ABC transporter ATP-binding protein [Spirochaetia bacterium]
MTLNIKGIGKILDSQIEMKGITVIAGKNNTGKSTFGKVLYCMFNAFYNADSSINDERVNDINRILSSASLPGLFYRYQSVTQKILAGALSFANRAFSPVEMQRIIKDAVSEIPSGVSKPDDQIIDLLVDDLKKSISVKGDDIQKVIITRYFKSEFERQINHVNKPELPGTVSLIIKGKPIKITISNNECTAFTDEVGILYDSIYIDTPFVVDEVQRYYTRNSRTFNPARYNLNTHHRDNLLHRLGQDNAENTVIEEALIKQKINGLLASIGSVVDGEFKEDKEGLLYLEHGLQKPIPLSNVSAGIKAFLIIKRLLETGEIRERGVLIFDEPEIHLHPEWQISFAEILILLQKEFNLTILLTTHSPYFLHAIEIYGKKHGIASGCNFYLAETDGDTAGVREVTDKIDEVYKQLAEPFQKLEDAVYQDA